MTSLLVNLTKGLFLNMIALEERVKLVAMSDEIMDTLPCYQGNRKTTLETLIGDLFFIRCSPKVFRSLRD